MNIIILPQNETKQAIELALKADTPLFIYGSTGIGKSEIVQEVAKKYNLEIVDIRLSQVSPYDLLGYPKDRNDRMAYLPIEDMPLETDPLPNGKHGFLLFLDEMNSADKYTMGAAYKLILDRKIGKHNLHPNCRIICAGNRVQDQAVVNKLVTPLKTRLTHIEMVVDNKQFLEYVYDETQAGNWHNYIHAFLSFLPMHINNFDPATDLLTYAVPRTWKMLSDQMQAGLLNLPKEVYKPIINGIVGESAGIAFSSFLDYFSEFPDIKTIESNPTNASLPTEIGAKWALGIYLANNLTQTNSNALIEYASRITEADLKVVIYRYLIMKNKALLNHPEIQKQLVQTQKLIVGL